MLVKSQELINFNNKKNVNYYLFYGQNIGLIEQTINKVFKPIFPKNVISYEETELLNNIESFKETVFNKSFFDDEKLIIINRASNKILDVVKELINSKITDIKVIIKAGLLEKKSKLRNYFENNKSIVISAFYEDNYWSLSLMLQEIFREKKINISNEIINLIIERSNGNRININNEIEKILSYCKKNNKINLEDVLKLTNLAENYDISELVNYNLSKNKKKTINILNENNLNSEENILILRTFLSKLKKLKNLKIELEKNINIEHVLSSSRPPIFWKDKEIVKQQLNVLSLNEIKYLINKVNRLELKIKKNNHISHQILNNFILENLEPTNNAI
jgi:DNA polymerase-3 subunit delta